MILVLDEKKLVDFRMLHIFLCTDQLLFLSTNLMVPLSVLVCIVCTDKYETAVDYQKPKMLLLCIFPLPIPVTHTIPS